MNKQEKKNQLKLLIERYNSSVRQQQHKNISEETIRTWLNEMLAIFGWNVQDSSQVLQERVLADNLKQKLESIGSTHTRPDYILKNGFNIKTFLDAKSVDVNIFCDKEAAFQIRSYGWSANVPCAFISNFEQFSIYETKNIPSSYDDAKKYVLYQFSIDDYLDNFDILFEHIEHDLVCSNHLESLYNNADLQGATQLDESFASILEQFRCSIAKDVFMNNDELIFTNEALNYYTQVILDRIIFIRVCEAKGIEKSGLLKSFCTDKKGFWACFKSSCYMEFYNHYDGILFSRDEVFNKLKVSDEILENFVNRLYYPNPYKFDIIPIKVIASIYEMFLGRQLVIKDEIVSSEIKKEYVKTNGTVSTPEYIVDIICRQTAKLQFISNIRDLLNLKILDPCCGSGIFLVACYELLAEKFIKIIKSSLYDAQKYREWYIKAEDKIYLTIEARRNLIKNCLYGIDFDDVAIEVTKMSLALKVVDGTEELYWDEIGAYGKKLLKDISENIKLGNTLVRNSENFSPEEIKKIKPFNIYRVFKNVFESKKGFDYIVGNPPYVETKFYKANSPVMHLYLSKHYKTFEKKADLSILFLERVLELLCENGRAGFIIQKRWFKSEYGKAIRNSLCENGYLQTLIDFSANDLFKGKQTYVAILILEKNKRKEFCYQFLTQNKEQIKNIFENADNDGNFADSCFTSLPMPQKNSVWAFEKHEIINLRERLAEKFGTLEDFPNLAIHDGIQALWKKMYHLQNVQFDGVFAIGFNGFKEKVKVEKEILRGIIYNREFYPFKNLTPDAYCIFPYYMASNDAIPVSELKKNYPLTYKYFSEHEFIIRSNVTCSKTKEWYAFTREHNHRFYETSKIIIPMTALDTIATYVSDKGLYMDNSNVWFITIEDANDSFMKAFSCLMNSTVFSVLAKAGANPQLEGYYKFNKQFLRPIPVPIAALEKTQNIEKLSKYYDVISDLQAQYLYSVGARKENIASILEEKWDSLDDFCNAFYELTDRGVSIINTIGRTSRIALLK